MSLIDDARVFIFDHNMFKIQATGDNCLEKCFNKFKHFFWKDTPFYNKENILAIVKWSSLQKIVSKFTPKFLLGWAPGTCPHFGGLKEA
jgi:hypothetical protein